MQIYEGNCRVKKVHTLNLSLLGMNVQTHPYLWNFKLRNFIIRHFSKKIRCHSKRIFHTEFNFHIYVYLKQYTILFVAMYIVRKINIYFIYIYIYTLHYTQYVYRYKPNEKLTISHTEGKFTPEYKKKKILHAT
jgi:hypothetical protein